ncbi:MAG: peptidylprolyl isomerase [Acidobacteria bacterium]|nr:peptidylprolyl isomerase [Acidobacteriota bacterium]
MNNLTKALILVVAVIGIGAALVYWKQNVAVHSAGDFSSITREEVELLIADAAKREPMALKQLADNPDLRKRQLESMKQLLAFASDAQRHGVASKPLNRNELVNIRNEVIAMNYDRSINADKGQMPQFGFISEDQVKAFWAGGDQSQQGFFDKLKNGIGLGKRDNEVAFTKFLDTKVALLAEANPAAKDRPLSDSDKEQAREFFAKIMIYVDEYNDKLAKGEIDETLAKRIGLQVKLQQAQFLARIYSEEVAKRIEVTDEDVAKYIAEHPEFDTSEKRAKAEEILARAKAGEDFAALANEFSEDPGNGPMGEGGEKRGGLYEKITQGQMVKPFEEAALALEPGQIAPQLVETDYGFHIIKLEKKSEQPAAEAPPAAEGQPPAPAQGGITYDARHILISTGYKDESNPFGREVPIKAYVKQKLEEERQKKAIDDIVAANNVQVPDDFSVPEVTDEQMKQMLDAQQPAFGDDGH